MSTSPQTSFVILHAELPSHEGNRLIEALQPSNVVVTRTANEDAYYLFSTTDLRRELEAASPDESLDVALRLDERETTPLVERDTAKKPLTHAAVFHENGWIVDVHLPRPRSRGGFGTAPRPRGTAVDTSERSLVAEFPERVEAGKTHSLLVSLGPGGSPEGLDLTLEAGTRVHIVVVPKRRFSVEGESEATIDVPQDKEETLPVRFALRATEAGRGEIVVHAFHGPRSLGRIKLHPLVASDVSEQSETHEQAMAPVSVRAPVADLALLILDEAAGGNPRYSVRVVASDPSLDLEYARFGPIETSMDARAYFRDFFRDIEGLPVESERDQATMTKVLETRGADLAIALFRPSGLEQRLWAIRERVDTVVIQSEESWIPWELCRLCGEEDGRPTWGPFLCERFEITRWIPGVRRRPVTLRDMAIVVPEDSELEAAADERAYLLGLGGNGRKVTAVPATYVDLQHALAAGVHDAWHFTGHGSQESDDANRSAIELRGRERFTPQDLAGEAERLGTSSPLVFLNACQTAQGGVSLTGVGGWAYRFLQAGAGAFIGTYWSVYDDTAFEFAKAFYERLLQGLAIGRAAREARRAVRASGNPTWLAYTVFADPLATLEQ